VHHVEKKKSEMINYDKQNEILDTFLNIQRESFARKELDESHTISNVMSKERLENDQGSGLEETTFRANKEPAFDGNEKAREDEIIKSQFFATPSSLNTTSLS